MNELQQVLLVFAVVVIGGLYFYSKRRQPSSPEEEGKVEPASAMLHKADAKQSPENGAQPSLKMAGQPLHSNVQDFEEAIESVPESQESLPFGEDFEAPTVKANTQSETVVTQFENEESESDKGATHHTLDIEELYSVEDVGPTVEDLPKPSFGIPEDTVPAAMQTKPKIEREQQMFVLMVLNTGGSGQEFKMDAINQALLSFGTTLSKNQIYVTTDSKGTEIIRIANIMEPGIFPTENLQSYTTPGLALILELPASIRAPAAMADLITLARKISQRLNGRLYNMERQLIKESDLQAMRDAAVNYESEPI